MTQELETFVNNCVKETKDLFDKFHQGKLFHAVHLLKLESQDLDAI